MGVSPPLISAIAGSVSAGASIPGVAAAFGGYQYNVTFMLELENYTDQHLYTHETKVKGGHITKPAVDVKPGVKEALAGHKVGDTATGCRGTVSWRIGKTNKILVVMYDVPYNQNFHVNQCAVGIFDKQHTGHLYDQMYTHDGSFQKKTFYYDTDPVSYKNSDYGVQATMGTDNKPEIQVRFYPHAEDKLANNIKYYYKKHEL